MFIILPNKIDGLSELETKLSQNSKLLDNIDEMIGETNVMVHIPKFKIETSVPMKELLVKLGVTDFFSESLADLSGISGLKGDLYCSEVYHKCFIEVNEEGGEAAAATGFLIVFIAILSFTLLFLIFKFFSFVFVFQQYGYTT